jgi:hypothetical protein
MPLPTIKKNSSFFSAYAADLFEIEGHLSITELVENIPGLGASSCE